MRYSWIHKIPWDWLKKKLYQVRGEFKHEPPKSGYIHVNATETELKLKMGSSHYGPDGSWMSYDKGEDINMARIEAVFWDTLQDNVKEELREYGDEHDIVWFQTHMRAWKTGEKSYKINGHWELDPFLYDAAHFDGVAYNDKKGLKRIIDDLEQRGIEITEYPEWYNPQSSRHL